MPGIGIDCEIIIDGNGYFVKPQTYKVKHPRLSKETYRADGGLSYIDLGPGRRTWSMVILALNDLRRYDGTTSPISGQQYRDTLRASYLNTIGGTIAFTDPNNGASINVYFHAYEEAILDLRTQIIAFSTGGQSNASYEISIELIEA